MKNKIICFAITIFLLLPNSTWACGGVSSDEATTILRWVMLLIFVISFIAMIALSLNLALKKNEENNKLRYGVILAIILLLLNIVIFYLYESPIGLILYMIFPIIIFILGMIYVGKIKDKKIKKWIVFSFSVLVVSFFILIIINAMTATLCGSVTF